jgi:hypothetical protein
MKQNGVKIRRSLDMQQTIDKLQKRVAELECALELTERLLRRERKNNINGFTHRGQNPCVTIMAIQVFCALGGLIVAFASAVLAIWIY